MKFLLLLTCISATVSLAACKSDGKSDGKPQSGLAMSSSSAACKKAMTCCELYVKAEHGTVTPENVNLTCSGVALATTDADCDAFRQGHAAALESKSKAVPPECK